MIISRTPLRVSFLGGGTDYPECISEHGPGAVLGTSIDKYLYCSASRFYSGLFDYSIHLSYREVERVRSLEEIRHIPMRRCLEYAGVLNDVEVGHTAELPAYSGLGSSSAFVVGLLNALYCLKGRRLEPLELARRAIHVERELIGDNVGLQDQTLSAVGGLNLAEFGGPQDIRVRPLELDAQRTASLESHLAMYFTGIQRKASEVISGQVGRVRQNAGSLGRMREMARRGAELLESGSGGAGLDEFGALVAEGWGLKRGLDGSVSSEAIDGMYERGISAGAYGGKLLGAGGGGFLLFVVAPSRRADLDAAMEGLAEVPIKTSRHGSSVIEGFTERT